MKFYIRRNKAAVYRVTRSWRGEVGFNLRKKQHIQIK
jgi:hypothetical protein